MNGKSLSVPAADESVAGLIALLHATEQRIDELTLGEVDTVADADGRILTLRSAQDRLRHGEAAKQAAILNALPAHIALLDAAGMIVSVNEAWRRFALENALLDPACGVGANYLETCDSVVGEDAALGTAVASGIRAVIAGSMKSYSVEYACNSPSDHRCFVLTVTPVTDDGQGGAVVTHLNVTAARRAEERLRDSELRFRQMAENIRDVFFLLDAESGDLLYISPAYEEIWGRTCESVYANSSSWADAFHPGRRAWAYAKYKGLLSGRFDYEFPIVRPDGSMRWIETRGFPVRDAAGKMVRIAGVAEDITARKQIAQELRAIQRRFSDMLDNVQLAAVMLDCESRITYCNEYLLRLTGWRHEEVIGQSWFELFLPPDVQLQPHFAKLVSDGTNSWNLESEIITRAAERRLIRWSHSLLRSGSGEVLGITSIGEDITERQRADVRIQRQNRVYAVLSGIDALIVRVHDREELFSEACRILVEEGCFATAWIAVHDPASGDVTPVAWAGLHAEAFSGTVSSSRDDVPRGTGAVGRAIRERRPILRNDLGAHDSSEWRREAMVAVGLRSKIVLPLIAELAVAGVLTIYSADADSFDEEEVRLLTALATDISFAIQHIGQQQKLVKLARIRAVLSEVNAAIVRIDDRKALLRETCRIAVEHGKFELVWAGLIDQLTERVEPVAWAGFSPELAQSFTWTGQDRPEGKLAEVFRTRKVAVSNTLPSAATAGPLRREASRRGCVASVSVPFVVADTVVAVMSLYVVERQFFDEGEVALLNEVSSNISFALEHMEEAEKVARLSRIEAVTSSINALIVRVHEHAELFHAACRIVVEDGRFPLAWIGKPDPETLDVIPVACVGAEIEVIDAARVSMREDLPRGNGAVGRCLRTHQPVFNNDIAAAGPPTARRAVVLGMGLQSHIALPLFDGERVAAVLAIYAREPHFFDEEEISRLTKLARNISFALQNITRQQTLDKLSRMRQVSSQINAAIVRIRDKKALLTEVGRIVCEQGKFELVWIGTIDEEAQQVWPLAWHGFSDGAAQGISWATMTAAKGTVCEAIHSQKPSVRNSLPRQLSGGELRQEALLRGSNSSLCLPLLVDDQVTAVIVLFAAREDFFDKDELALLSEVSLDISFALQAIDKQERLDYFAYYDALTGLANRSLFVERLAQYARTAASDGHKLAVYLLDVERFKNLNDTLGQPAGDALLKQVAGWLSSYVGEAALVARVTADKFAVVLPDMRDVQEVGRIVGKTLDAFMDHHFDVGDDRFRIAAKAGVALFPEDGADAGALFSNAEAALKKAKAGGDRYLFYTQEMTELVARKLTLENKLREALAREELILHFQPKVTLATGEISGFEALLRWQSPDGPLVAPDDFIPLLEETGLIVPVGAWVLRKACEQIQAWTEARIRPVAIAVNLSARQLQHGVSEMVAATLRAHRVPARLIEIEITESGAMQNPEASIVALHALKALGVALSIDDFGTGYSSLSYLKRLPISTVKIDRSFITDLASNPDDASIAQAIVNMAHALGLNVVAEGVETSSQLTFLAAHGCDQMQGYYFSRPVGAAEATQMLRENRQLERPGGSPDGGENTLLLLDDDENVLASLKRLLRRDNYRIFSAGDAPAAFEILANQKVGVIVSDQRMPGMTGVEFLRRVKELYPDSVRMVLSGFTEIDSVTDAINQGAVYRFLTKPWDDSLLRANIAEAFRRYASAQESNRTQRVARERVDELSRMNQSLQVLLDARAAGWRDHTAVAEDPAGKTCRHAALCSTQSELPFMRGAENRSAGDNATAV